ncbi:cingulin-like protein 1 [Gymnodraco acuticeps]|uniref:Cingulin-like protein 1 n=1 Tax=Gymnodraco acuticeps TaxID=8218 RepID=A0A6P8TWY0_GYMAC|nr:cingulin-like protein 1 [Gymnodraco acuticeps]
MLSLPKEPAAVPVSSGGKQAASKTSVTYGRSNSLGTRDPEHAVKQGPTAAKKLLSYSEEQLSFQTQPRARRELNTPSPAAATVQRKHRSSRNTRIPACSRRQSSVLLMEALHRLLSPPLIWPPPSHPPLRLPSILLGRWWKLEQTQRELSRLRQLNRNQRDEVQQERARHASEMNDLLSNSNSSSEQALVLQRLHKMNHDLRLELEDQKSSFEETREVELRRRVDLLAQQAQILVTGDATALAQARLEQDRQKFMEQRQEWERCRASLKSQLSASEGQRKEAVSRSTQLQQELQSYHSLEQEAQRLHKHLQEVTTQLQANEEAQAQKEARLQEHLMLLQASQDRERRSLASSLAQAEQLTQELQRRLDMSELEVDSLNKTQTWTRDIEEAQQQLQEELACTVSVVQKLQDERGHLDRCCQELQSQLGEADGEVSRLQSRLKTDETHYYNLEHSFERVSEELQLALGKERQRESELQEIREGYERLLDRKEQELTEVLLKMEVLGNSLEETEVRLNEKLKVCSCGSPQNDRRPNVDHAGDDPESFMSDPGPGNQALFDRGEAKGDHAKNGGAPESHRLPGPPPLLSADSEPSHRSAPQSAAAQPGQAEPALRPGGGGALQGVVRQVSDRTEHRTGLQREASSRSG